MRPIIDTHLDLAWNALGWGRDITAELSEINAAERQMTDELGRGRATTCLPEMRRGGVSVCLATVLARVKLGDYPAAGRTRACLDYPNPAIAYAAGQGQLAYYRLLERQGEIRFLESAGDLDNYWRGVEGLRGAQTPTPNPSPADGGGELETPNPSPADGGGGSETPEEIGVILAMEGADPIVSPEQAEEWFRAGLRSVSLAHYGPSRYAVGTGETGPLSSMGRELLDVFERLGMILDVTHLSEPGFSEAIDRFGGALMASHNNCRALVPGDRQFSDEQIRKLIDRDAVIGVAFDAWMLYPDWVRGQTDRAVVGIAAAADHVDHLCQLAGNCRHVGIGSDLDGGYGTEQTPRGLDTIADLQELAGILSARGYRDGDVDAVFHGNWLRFFRQHLPK